MIPVDWVLVDEPDDGWLPHGAAEPVHVLVGTGCSCGGWSAPLGKSVWREFDKHLLAVRDTGSAVLSPPG